jgi:hypothetical protein
LEKSFEIKSDNAVDPVQAVLLLIAGTRYCSFGVMNHLTKELTDFGYYAADENENHICRKVFEQNSLLNQRFYQSAIAYDIAEAVQVPAACYKYEDSKLHLKALYGANGQSALMAENLPEWNLYNVYRVPSEIHGLLSQKLVTGKYWHTASVQLKQGFADNLILVHFTAGEFSVTVIKEKNLQLVQRFEYAAPEDVLYYLLKICGEFSLSQRSVKLVLSGLVEKDSAVCRAVFTYFLHVVFDSLPDGISLSGAFADYPVHYFSPVCKLAACVS